LKIKTYLSSGLSISFVAYFLNFSFLITYFMFSETFLKAPERGRRKEREKERQRKRGNFYFSILSFSNKLQTNSLSNTNHSSSFFPKHTQVHLSKSHTFHFLNCIYYIFSRHKQILPCNLYKSQSLKIHTVSNTYFPKYLTFQNTQFTSFCIHK